MSSKIKTPLISIIVIAVAAALLGALVLSQSSVKKHLPLGPRIYQLDSAPWLTFPWWKGSPLGIYHNARDISIVEEPIGFGPNAALPRNITVTFYTAKGALLSFTGSRPFITTWQPKGIETSGNLLRLRR